MKADRSIYLEKVTTVTRAREVVADADADPTRAWRTSVESLRTLARP